tara:strand:+ start:4207 stop:4815 length:609 start_codon:yes stop_codon:yes gene_type:complete
MTHQENPKMNNHFELFKNLITDLSVSDDYEKVITEWVIYQEYEVTGDCPAHCLCTKQIFDVFVIKNKFNGNDALVGNVCITKFSPKLAIEGKLKKDKAKYPEKFCLKCKTKMRKKNNEDIYQCKKCLLVDNKKIEYDKLKKKGEKTIFRIGRKYNGKSWLEISSKTDYNIFCQNLDYHSKPLLLYLKWLNDYNTAKTEFFNQ